MAARRSVVKSKSARPTLRDWLCRRFAARSESSKEYPLAAGRPRDSPAPKASGWPRPKAEPRSGRKSPSGWLQGVRWPRAPSCPNLRHSRIMWQNAAVNASFLYDPIDFMRLICDNTYVFVYEYCTLKRRRNAAAQGSIERTRNKETAKWAMMSS